MVYSKQGRELAFELLFQPALMLMLDRTQYLDHYERVVKPLVACKMNSTYPASAYFSCQGVAAVQCQSRSNCIPGVELFHRQFVRQPGLRRTGFCLEIIVCVIVCDILCFGLHLSLIHI